MLPIHKIKRLIYGDNYIPDFGGGSRQRTQRRWGKHRASKRGYQHKHRPSRGELNHQAFISGRNNA